MLAFLFDTMGLLGWKYCSRASHRMRLSSSIESWLLAALINIWKLLAPVSRCCLVEGGGMKCPLKPASNGLDVLDVGGLRFKTYWPTSFRKCNALMVTRVVSKRHHPRSRR